MMWAGLDSFREIHFKLQCRTKVCAKRPIADAFPV